MGQAIAVRTDFTTGEVRRFAKRARDGGQARRLLAIAAVLDGASREEAAEIGGMDRQTLRDWVIRFNAQGPDGLINIASPGVPPKLGKKHRAFLVRLVEEGPIPAVHGVVRWRACDLITAASRRPAARPPPEWPVGSAHASQSGYRLWFGRHTDIGCCLEQFNQRRSFEMAKLAPLPQSCGDGCRALDQMWAAFLFGVYPSFYAVRHTARGTTV